MPASVKKQSCAHVVELVETAMYMDITRGISLIIVMA